MAAARCRRSSVGALCFVACAAGAFRLQLAYLLQGSAWRSAGPPRAPRGVGATRAAGRPLCLAPAGLEARRAPAPRVVVCAGGADDGFRGSQALRQLRGMQSAKRRTKIQEERMKKSRSRMDGLPKEDFLDPVGPFKYKKLRQAQTVCFGTIILPFPYIGDLTRDIDLLAGNTIVGALLAAAGFIVAAFSGWQMYATPEGMDGYLISSKAFSIVRHPIYCGYLLTAVGCCLVWLSPLRLVVFLALFAVCFLKVLAEEDSLGTDLPEEWEAYCRKVPNKFVPFLF